jgi:hypothetical protein
LSTARADLSIRSDCGSWSASRFASFSQELKRRRMTMVKRTSRKSTTQNGRLMPMSRWKERARMKTEKRRKRLRKKPWRG